MRYLIYLKEHKTINILAFAFHLILCSITILEKHFQWMVDWISEIRTCSSTFIYLKAFSEDGPINIQCYQNNSVLILTNSYYISYKCYIDLKLASLLSWPDFSNQMPFAFPNFLNGIEVMHDFLTYLRKWHLLKLLQNSSTFALSHPEEPILKNSQNVRPASIKVFTFLPVLLKNRVVD